jgi:hypothetical protein
VTSIKQQPPQIEIELVDQPQRQVGLDALDRLWRDPVHIVPVALAGELAALDRDQPPQHRLVEPRPHLGLAAGGHTAVEDGDQQVGTDRRAPTALGHMVVDDGHQIQAAR